MKGANCLVLPTHFKKNMPNKIPEALITDGMGVTWPFFTMENSIHDMIRELINVHGLSWALPAKLRICTFSISEAAIREFISLKDDRLVNEIEIIIDHTARKNKLDMLLFANENTKVFLADVHAKVIVIEAGNQIVIMTSANMNTIKRYEAGIISINSAITAYFIEQLEELKQLSIPFTIE
jgi:hypothetical protein